MSRDVILVFAPHRAQADAACLAPPLGLLYIGAVLRQDGFSVELLDFRREDVGCDRLVDDVKRHKPAWVGFSTDSDGIFRAMRLKNRVLEANPDVVCVLGGPHVSELAERYVSDRTFVVRGEGEYAALQLTRYLVRGEGSLRDVPSLAYLDGEVGASIPLNILSESSVRAHVTQSSPSAATVAATANRLDEQITSDVLEHALPVRMNAVGVGPYTDLTKIPFPDYTLLATQDGYGVSLTTSRGCPYQCHFCVEGNPDKKYRARPLDDVERELEVVRERANGEPVFLMFADDTFTMNSRRIEDVCDRIDRVFPDKRDFVFFCEARVNVLGPRPELVHRLKASGLVRLQLGIESGSQTILDSMRKGQRVEHIERVVQACEEADVETVFGCFLFGLPGQSEEDLAHNIRFARQLTDLAPARFETEASILCPLPGTNYRDCDEQWQLRIHDEDFVTGEICEDCFCDTEEMHTEKIQEYYTLFREELSRYYLSKLHTVSPERLKQSIRMLSRFKLVSQMWRLLHQTDHVGELIKSFRRAGVGFLNDYEEERIPGLCPRKLSKNVKHIHGRWFVNESSPFGFVLENEEAKIYKYFAGKLTFEEIVTRLARSGECGEGRGNLLDIVLELYKKCEDRLAVVATEF